MTKSELIEQIAKDAGVTKAAAKLMVNSFLDTISNELEKEEDLEHSQQLSERPAKVEIRKRVKQ